MTDTDTTGSTKVDTTYTVPMKRDYYITRVVYAKAGDEVVVGIAYSYKEHERQKFYLALNKRLRGWG